jgi:Protein of unknown function (DUF429)
MSREASPSSPRPARDVRLIGVDWSTEESNRGVAVVDYAQGATSLIDLSPCTSRQTALRLIADAMSTTSGSSVVAIDAPLGWPAGLAAALANHSAGEGLELGADEMFSRETDRFVQRTLNKRRWKSVQISSPERRNPRISFCAISGRRRRVPSRCSGHPKRCQTPALSRSIPLRRRSSSSRNLPPRRSAFVIRS